jgi:uncharacterized protein YlxP (DUF503 family)
MFIGILTIDLSIPYRETIKERRNVLRSIKDMVRKKFNVSIAEVDNEEEISPRARLAVTVVSNDSGYLQSVLANVYNLVESFHPDKIVSYQTDFLMHE